MKGRLLTSKLNSMTRVEYEEYKSRRFSRLGLNYMCILDERPKQHFTEKEWLQFQKDDTIATICILDNLPIPEDIEERLMQAALKLRE